MTLKEQLEATLKESLLKRMSERSETLRGLKAAVLNEEVATGMREQGLGDEAMLAVFSREAKKRRESIKLYQANGREDLANSELQELAIIEEFLPQQLNQDKVREIIDKTVNELGINDIKGLGRVIGQIKKQYGAEIDGAMLAQLTKERLSS